jgi:hypothetical protein
VCGDQLAEVGRALGALPGHPGEQPLVGPGLELQLAGGQHQPDVGARHDLARHRVVQRLQGHQHGGPRVGEQVGELPLPAHRVDRHHDAAGLPGGDHRDDELRHVLQVDGQPVAGCEAVGQQAAGQRVAELVELPPGDAAVEVLQGDGVRIPLHPGAEHVQGVVELHRVVGRLVPVQRQPGSFVVGTHPGSYLMTTGLTGAPLPWATFSGAAT